VATLAQLRQIMTRNPHGVAQAYPFLLAGMRQYDIQTVLRQAAFIATIAHESAELTRTTERGSGDGPDSDKFDDYLQKYDTGRMAKKLGNTPEADGDGIRFKGRGLIMLTGHDNYLAFAKHKGMTLEEVIKYLESPEGATEASCWWWAEHGCNELADTGDFQAVTRRVNGGLNGWESRRHYYRLALVLFGQPDFSNAESGGASTAPVAGG
jgi:putative chitinase